LLVQCARVFIQRIDYQSGKLADWVRAQLARKHSCVVCCPLANKLALIAWAITTRQTLFKR
ncbi:IS110 family transposase, partial [Yersinia enterocolitica]|nr:IS110 family transposase [Yersinia enterocolitica]